MTDEETSPQTSTSVLRDPGSFQDFVRGSTKYVPFLPGGVENESDSNKTETKKTKQNETKNKELSESELLDPKPEG
jgi:antiviral helicase SKI2